MKAKDTFGHDSAAARYNRALSKARETQLPPGYCSPQPTSAWPPENVDLLERYRTWLMSGGISPYVINLIHIPTAGHVLGLALKSHPQLDLEADFSIVLDYVTAKGLSAPWIKNARNSLVKFRKFLRHERGLVDVAFSPLDNTYAGDDLPAWVVEPLERFRQIAQRGWRPTRVTETSRRFWFVHGSMWRWFVEHRAVTSFADLKRQHILDYIQHMLTQGLAVSTINNSIRSLHSFLHFMQDQDFAIPQALLRPPTLKEPERLPRFLTDEQVCLVRDEVERVVADAKFVATRRDALLVRAAFYLLWQAGLRLGEVEELRLEDLDLAGRKLAVRSGKGQKDRVVYLTDTSVQAIQAYLPVRGEGTSNHVFLYRHHPVCKDLIRCRVKAAGERVGVKVSPHQLRHSCATQLLNAGCKVTSIQKLLGHRRLDTTLVYARMHDHTVSTDFYAAMARIEKQLELANAGSDGPLTIPLFTHAALLALSNRLAEPELKPETRLELVRQLQSILNGKVPELAEPVAV